MKIDTIEVFTFPVHNAAGRLADADALPVASVFEDDGDAAMDNPTVEQIGAITGWYRVIVDADSALYTVGKTYNVHVDLTVGGIDMGARVTQFYLEANNIDDVAQTALAVQAQTDKLIFNGSDQVEVNVAAMEDGVIVASKIGLGAITADKIAAAALDDKGNWSKAGDEMDLVDAPNATAVIAIQSGLATSLEVGTVDGKVDDIKAKTDLLAFTGNDVKATLDGETVDVGAISGDSGAADALESQFDGTGLTGDTYPARQDQLDTISVIGSAVKVVAGSFTLATGSEVGGTTYTNTHQYDGTVHQLADAAGTMDGYYEFDAGPEGIPVDVTLFAAVTGLNDYVDIFGYIWGTTSWAKMGTIAGGPSTTPVEKQFTLLASMVGTGANLGKVRVRVYGTGLTSANFYNDFMTVSYSINRQTVGYADGAVWVKAAGTSGTTPYVHGVADNPCPWADALVVAAAIGLARFRIASGETVTLAAAFDEKVVIGKNWDLALGGQDVTDAFIEGARVSGIGTSTGSAVIMEYCGLGAVSLPACRLYQCGIGRGSGAFSASQAGQFNIIDCFSLVPGAAVPSLDFSGTGGTTGISMRGWKGGSNITLDGDCTLSLEVLAGGGQTIDVGAGAAEIRGICRSLTLTMEAGGVAQFAGVTGPVTINGTGGTVRLYGVTGEITDNSGGTVTIITDTVPSATENRQEMDANSIQLGVIRTNSDRVDGLIEDDGGDLFTAHALSKAPGGGGVTPAQIWEYLLTGSEGGGSAASILLNVLRASPALKVKPGDIFNMNEDIAVDLLSVGISSVTGLRWRWILTDRHGNSVAGMVSHVFLNGTRLSARFTGGDIAFAPYKFTLFVREWSSPSGPWLVKSFGINIEGEST